MYHNMLPTVAKIAKSCDGAAVAGPADADGMS